jgi:L-aminopeptidase/D-esterase-like protein
VTANCLTDVAGVAVGHHRRLGRGWRTGTTVVVLPQGSCVGVDVRGGGPGTRETDLLAPVATLQTAHAICLTGGSAYGLAAADGVMAELERRGVGLAITAPPGGVVPLVPAAVIFDLGRGGVFANRPDADFGRRATRAARTRPCATGSEGAGTGARSGGMQGGVGTASTVLADGTVVAALAVVNSAGSVIDPATGLPWHSGSVRLRRPSAAQRAAVGRHVAAPSPSLNTTIGVVATDATLTKAECAKLAAVAHDGLARAVRPVHSLFDGDTIFGAATGARPLGERIPSLNAILAAGAQCFAAACTDAVVLARATGEEPSYRDLCPSAFPPGFLSPR